MAQKVIMPKQGLQMTEGTILKWLVQEGGACKEGEPLFEMETDKLTITIDAPASGTLLKTVRGEGETVPITELIAVIGQDGEDISSFFVPPAPDGNEAAKPASSPEEGAPAARTQAAQAPSGGQRVFVTPRAREAALQKNIDLNAVGGSGPEGLIIERDILTFDQNKAKATPLAKKVAQQEGVDISAVEGSGERGKVIKEDVLKALPTKKPGLPRERGERLIPFTGMRKVIAERMKQSQNTAAQTTHNVRVDMSEATRLRESLKKAEIKISFNDIIAYAVCQALLKYPRMNAVLTSEGIIEKEYVNLGVAVALDNGLIVPVIRDADTLTLTGLSENTKILAQKAKEGKLSPDDYTGGSFTISNLGMFGLDDFVAIINPPETGILAVGKIEKSAVVIADEIVIRPMMALTLSYDHRVIDGAPAAQFLMQVKTYLENPYLLL